MEDNVNTIFEMMGGIFVWISVKRLHADKIVKGVDYKHIAFFTCWGFWNLHYYPSVGCTLSYYGSMFTTLANSIWLIQLVYYRNRIT